MSKEELREYHKRWRKENLEQSKIIKQRYEIKRKEKRKQIKKEKEENKYF